MNTFILDECLGRTVGNCHVEQVVSSGGMSVVYRAQQLRPKRPVALTFFLLPETMPAPIHQQFRTRFLREAPALTLLRHPHVFPVHSYGEWEGWLYLMTPYHTEGSLATTIKQRRRWSPASIVPVLEQIVAGVEYAHSQRQVHGMLTPANVLCSGNDSFQIAGFGLQHLLERRGILACEQPAEEVLTLAGSSLCAPKYLAPEYQQGQTASRHSDVYSLGVILVELLCGRFLPREISTEKLLALLERQGEWSLPTSLRPVIRRALAAESKRRFPRASDLFSAYAERVDQEEEGERKQLSPVRTSLMSSSSHSQLKEDDIHLYADDGWSPPSFAQWWSPFPSSSLPLREAQSDATLPRQPRGRRRVTALLAGGLVIGILGAGGTHFIQTLTADKPVPTIPAAKGIGQTTQALNSAQVFLDQRAAEHRQRLLIHLPNGNFVAYKQGCTHSGVLVNYDPKTHRLVCPAHGAIFDPAQGGRVIQGPATTPLPPVAIQVSSTGMITLT
jgi:serine/threonine protein kinase/Rieske Fe-S protein